MRRIRAALWPAGAAALAMTLAPTASAQLYDEDENDHAYEYEPDEGLHQEEWYDPSDWFDQDEAIDYEYDLWESPDYYDYDADYDYGWGYWWDPVEMTWYRDYGWHYEWDPIDGRWERDYGFHDEPYGYYTIDYYDVYTEEERAERREEARAYRDGERKKVAGTIVDFKRVVMTGEDSPHTIVKLKMKDGKSAVVDIGPEMTLTDLNLDKGDKVTIRGRRGAVNDRQVLLASSITVEGDQMTIDRMREMQMRQNTLRGVVEKVSKAKIKGYDEEHTLLQLTLADGSKKTVDLGPRVDRSTLAIDRGDEILVRGRLLKHEGRTVLAADKIRVEDEILDIQLRRPEQVTKNQREQFQTVRGMLEELRKAKLKAAGEETTIARLRLRDGRSILVDLGTRFSMRDLPDGLLGSEVALRGSRVQIDGREVFRARSMMLEGDLFPDARAAVDTR